MKQIIFFILIPFSLYAMENVEFLKDPEEATPLLNSNAPPDTETYCCNSKLIHQGFAFTLWIAGGATNIYYWNKVNTTQKALATCTQNCAELADDLSPWQALLPLGPIVLLGALHLVHTASRSLSST